MDLKILQWINENLHQSAFLNAFFKYITFLGNAAAIWIATGILLLCFKKTRTVALILFIALLFEALVVNVILKNAVGRVRPFMVDDKLLQFIESISLKIPQDSSFPSGHTASSFVCASVLFFYFRRAGIFALLLALLISFSRLFLCVHYPSDVLWGALIGMIAAGITLFFAEKIIKKRIKKSFSAMDS